MTERMQGTVKWFNDSRGYGFIAPDGGDKDIFVHHTDIQKTPGSYASLGEGDRVEFGVKQTEKGPNATNVVKL